MNNWNEIPVPVNFNPLKHHMGFIRSFSGKCSIISEEKIKSNIIPLLKHLGSSVADIYTGSLDVGDIVSEVSLFREKENIMNEKSFLVWLSQTGKDYNKCTLSDSSQWVIKHLDNNPRYFHIFPGRNLECTVRSRGNSLKTAILFDILYDKGDILLSDLNSVRRMLSLSPLRSTESAFSIIEDIRMLQMD
ncbi:MAG TPA: hypothetical protein DEQ09_10480 [Bacteroidales bacterium]|mgnify:CR=1 FL=1|nr:hypothetical protein [Bacteroidales bacterium]